MADGDKTEALLYPPAEGAASAAPPPPRELNPSGAGAPLRLGGAAAVAQQKLEARQAYEGLSGWQSNRRGKLQCCRWLHRGVLVLSFLSLFAGIGLTVYFFGYKHVWDRATVSLIAAIWAASIATINTVFSIGLHMQSYSVPEHQKKIIRIMMMVPIYAISSCVALFLEDNHAKKAQFVDIVRNSYEAFALYTFYDLIQQYLLNPDGGEELPEHAPRRRQRLCSVLRKEGALTLPHPPPLCKLKPLQITPRTFAIWDICVMQYVLLNPLLVCVACVGTGVGFYDEEAGLTDYSNAYPYILILENLSVSVAFTCIFYLYVLTHDVIPRLADFTCPNVTNKFLALKFVIFMCFWQGVVISCMVKMKWIKGTEDEGGNWTESEVAAGIQNWLVAVEMMIVSIAHKVAFSHKPYLYLSIYNRERLEAVATASPDGMRKRDAFFDAIVDFRDVHKQTTSVCGTFCNWLRGIDDVYDARSTFARSRAASLANNSRVPTNSGDDGTAAALDVAPLLAAKPDPASTTAQDGEFKTPYSTGADGDPPPAGAGGVSPPGNPSAQSFAHAE